MGNNGRRRFLSSHVVLGSVAVLPTATTVSALTGTAAGTFFALSGDVDIQCTAAQFFAIECVKGFLGLFGRGHSDESKPAWPSGDPISDDVGFDNGAERRERILQVVFGNFEIEIPDE